MGTFKTIRHYLAQVLHLQESPHRTALAFATGVFIAFAPHYFFHTASVVLVAWAFRLNYIAVFLGAFINNPWTLIPILAASLYTGLVIMGDSTRLSIDWDNLNAANIFDLLFPYLLPFVVGSITLAILAGLLSYPIMRWTVTKYRTFKGRNQ